MVFSSMRDISIFVSSWLENSLSVSFFSCALVLFCSAIWKWSASILWRISDPLFIWSSIVWSVGFSFSCKSSVRFSSLMTLIFRRLWYLGGKCSFCAHECLYESGWNVFQLFYWLDFFLFFFSIRVKIIQFVPPIVFWCILGFLVGF